MPLLIVAVLRWLLSKIAFLAAVVFIVVAAYASYSYLSEHLFREDQRVQELERARIKVHELEGEIVEARDQVVAIGEKLVVVGERIRQANQIIETMKGIKHSIEYVFLTAKEQYQYDRQLRESNALKKSQEMLARQLFDEKGGLEKTIKELSVDLGGTEYEIDELLGEESQVLRYLLESWLQLKPYVYWSLLAVVLGPVLGKAVAYYGLTGLVAFSKPIRFSEDSHEMPVVGGSSVSAVVSLTKGDRAWIKETYLQASDETLKKRTRLVLDWRIPVTCFAAGLVELIEFNAIGEVGGVITVSTQDRPEMEIGNVELNEACSLIVRPRHIAGLVSRNGSPVEIRRHWRLFHLQSWVTLRFRYFEIVGPCAVLLSGIRGVRLEDLNVEGNRGRRTNQEATIAFTPGLSYRVVKAETFWSYFRGLNPLFDDVFRGNGIFLCQEISSSSNGPLGRKFWSRLWSSVLKVLGV